MSRYDEFCAMSGAEKNGKGFKTQLNIPFPHWTVLVSHEQDSEDIGIIAMDNRTYQTIQVPGSEKLSISEELDMLGEIMRLADCQHKK